MLGSDFRLMRVVMNRKSAIWSISGQTWDTSTASINSWLRCFEILDGYFYLHIRVSEATSRQVVCVHGHWLLLGSQVLILVQRQRIHWAFVVQAPLTENKYNIPKKTHQTHATFGPSQVAETLTHKLQHSQKVRRRRPSPRCMALSQHAPDEYQKTELDEPHQDSEMNQIRLAELQQDGKL